MLMSERVHGHRPYRRAIPLRPLSLRSPPHVQYSVRMVYVHKRQRKDRRVEVRMDDATLHLLDTLASSYHSDRSHVVRLAVAKLAAQEGIADPEREHA